MRQNKLSAGDPVRERLLDAARECFLADDYHRVTTRRIARLAGANVSMIRYYFGSKEGLYEEMIRATLAPLIDVLDRGALSDLAGFEDFFRLYYTTMSAHPDFPRLILKVIALDFGPGKRFIEQMLDRGRARGERRVASLKSAGHLSPAADPDIVRLAFVSLAMMPMLLKGFFERQTGRPMDDAFVDALAKFNGRLFAGGLKLQEGAQ